MHGDPGLNAMNPFMHFAKLALGQLLLLSLLRDAVVGPSRLD